MSIIEFLEARLAEDERIALAAASRTRWWRSGGSGVVGGGEPYTVDWEDGPDYTDYANAHTIVYDEGWPLDTEALHIARHDPARVLREVAAKRAILADARIYPDAAYPDFDGGFSTAAESAVASLAAVYSDHPDFDPEWAA